MKNTQKITNCSRKSCKRKNAKNRKKQKIMNCSQKSCERKNAKSKRKQKINRIQTQRGKNISFQLFQTINHFFPNLFQDMRELEDCRKKSDYELAELIMACKERGKNHKKTENWSLSCSSTWKRRGSYARRFSKCSFDLTG